MSFLYPRLIRLSRAVDNNTVGAQPYFGTQAAQETPIASNIPAHIQLDRTGGQPETRLPANAAGQSIWRIVFRSKLGTVQDRDIITDDLGKRYHVISADWNPLVTSCRCEILET